MAKMGRVLVTGRYGFTGRYVASALAANGWDVWGTGAAHANETDPKYIPAELSDAGAVEDVIETVAPDAVIHLAAIAFVGHGSIEDFYRVNVVGTRYLLGALEKSRAGQSGVVLASSANIYGNARDVPITEATPAAPVNDYAVSKLAMEAVAQLYRDIFPLTVVRPFNYTGLGQSPQFLVPKIVRHFQERSDYIELGNLDVSRDFSDVRDVAQIYAALLEHTDAPDILNICSGQATTLEDVITMCRHITGHEIDVHVNPDFVRANEVKVLVGDASESLKIWPSNCRYRLQDTLAWMLEASGAEV